MPSCGISLPPFRHTLYLCDTGGSTEGKRASPRVVTKTRGQRRVCGRSTRHIRNSIFQNATIEHVLENSSAFAVLYVSGSQLGFNFTHTVPISIVPP